MIDLQSTLAVYISLKLDSPKVMAPIATDPLICANKRYGAPGGAYNKLILLFTFGVFRSIDVEYPTICFALTYRA